MRGYVFVDAENHFLRSTAAAKEIVGSSRAAEAIALAVKRVPGIIGFPDGIEGRQVGWDPDLQLFWYCHVLSRGGILTGLPTEISRAVYACSSTGDDESIHEARVRLRSYGFEPVVIRESKDLRARRQNSLKKYGLIEKPKGCDIAIATRMVADAAADLYDCCLLFTSDVDFLPAIQAVRQMGKIVRVFGYQDGLSKRSPYLYVPDRFVDLGKVWSNLWVNKKQEIGEALTALEKKSTTLELASVIEE